MRRYAVIKTDADLQAQFEALECGLHEIQRQTELLFALEGTEEAPGARVHIWSERWHRKAKVEFVDDYELPVRYLVIEAADEGQVERILDTITRYLGSEAAETLRERARDRTAQEPAALVRMALAEADPPDPDSVEIVRRHLAEDAPVAVRNAAVMAAAVMRPPDLIPDLDRLREEVTDPNERQMIEQAIQDCQEPTT